ncbi:MAG: hypothetical protein KDD06_02010 [Phaeodactylibacter sp.]|nr:hypothetical protein [Phaeodactylibacter sp.]MCB9266565.1 hypothetical protein [Lewinellaceae bacterium]MCB9288639.1 hypothetical protein [Lewinellaceae bacterium]
MSATIRNSLLLFILALITACYEPVPGCLDVEAVNYDLEADKNEASDCEYPKVRLALQHRYSKGDTIFRFGLADSVYFDALGNPFRVNNVRFYISNFHLIYTNGQEKEMDETVDILIPQPDGSELPRTIEDNFSLASPRVTQNYTIGTLKESGTLKEIRFAVGVEGLANLADPTSFPETHPLFLQDSSLYFNQDSGYVFEYIELFRDTTAADTIPQILRIGTDAYLKEVRLPIELEKSRGFHLLLTLQVDYSRWFGNINAREDSPEELTEKIVANLAQSFSIVAAVLQSK